MTTWRKSGYCPDANEIGLRVGVRDSKSTGHLPVAAPTFPAAVKSDSVRCR